MTDGDRDFVNAAKLAVEDGLAWKRISVEVAVSLVALTTLSFRTRSKEATTKRQEHR